MPLHDSWTKCQPASKRSTSLFCSYATIGVVGNCNLSLRPEPIVTGKSTCFLGIGLSEPPLESRGGGWEPMMNLLPWIVECRRKFQITIQGEVAEEVRRRVQAKRCCLLLILRLRSALVLTDHT